MNMERKGKIALTDKFISDIPTDKCYKYDDLNCVGLRICVYPNGEKCFFGRVVNKKGKSTEYKLGVWPTMILVQAKKAYQLLLIEEKAINSFKPTISLSSDDIHVAYAGINENLDFMHSYQIDSFNSITRELNNISIILTGVIALNIVLTVYLLIK